MTSVLIVEDDQQFRSAVVRDLVHRGYEVTSAVSVQDALTRLRQGAFDVVLTDLRMDDRDGIDLLEELSELSPRTRSILMSAHASARDHQRAMDLGAVQVLCKPFSSAELMRAIQQAIDCESGFRGSVHGLSLVDMLQMFHYSRRSLSIYISLPVGGEVHFDGGEIVHAKRGAMDGEVALRSILAMPSGSVHTTSLMADAVTIKRDFQSLLLDVLREVDEGRRDDDESESEDPFGFGVVLGALDSTPPEAPPAPPALPAGQALHDACRRAVEAVEHARACGIVDLEVGTMIGVHGVDGFESGAEAILAAGTVALVRSPSLERLDAIAAGGEPLGPGERTPIREVRLSSERDYHFVRVVEGGQIAIVLVAAREMNPGLGWAQLKAVLPSIERCLP
jgi:CheY-like chemotaxis protein